MKIKKNFCVNFIFFRIIYQKKKKKEKPCFLNKPLNIEQKGKNQ